jgi:hypothetical protein
VVVQTVVVTAEPTDAPAPTSSPTSTPSPTAAFFPPLALLFPTSAPSPTVVATAAAEASTSRDTGHWDWGRFLGAIVMVLAIGGAAAFLLTRRRVAVWRTSKGASHA